MKPRLIRKNIEVDNYRFCKKGLAHERNGGVSVTYHINELNKITIELNNSITFSQNKRLALKKIKRLVNHPISLSLCLCLQNTREKIAYDIFREQQSKKAIEDNRTLNK